MAKVFSERLSLERRIRTAVLALLLCAQAGFGFSVAGQQESTCEANGSIYYVGEWYFLDSDHCTQCECTAEGSACARTECTSLPAACIHVSHYPTDCCPRCEKIGCEYRGVVFELGQNFQVSLELMTHMAVEIEQWVDRRNIDFGILIIDKLVRVRVRVRVFGFWFHRTRHHQKNQNIKNIIHHQVKTYMIGCKIGMTSVFLLHDNCTNR